MRKVTTFNKLWERFKHPALVDGITIGIMIAAFIALIVLMYYQFRPVATVDIKVPVATDRSAYVPGEPISGIFFGKVFFNGHVEVTREVFCANYRGTIKTDDGQTLFKGVSEPATLEGVTRYIGLLPKDIPIGQNCVVQFVNIYRVATPFGDRLIDYDYYTQNFAIISQERRDILDCEARGEKDCVERFGNVTEKTAEDSPNDHQAGTTEFTPLYPPVQPNTSNSPQQVQAPQQPNQPSTPPSNPPPNNPPPASENPPVIPPEPCLINILGLCIRL